MESVFLFRDYRKFLLKCFRFKAKNGFGQATKLAEFLGVHNTFVSQVMNGNKSFSDEQALRVTRYLNLNEDEAEFFLLLVKFDKAGTRDYKQHLERQIDKLKTQSQELINRVMYEATLSEEQRAVFYSDWIYSAIRLATLLPSLKTVRALSEHFGVSLEQVQEIVDFLLQANLLKLEKGELCVGPMTTHLDVKSPWVKAHHSNWRQQALNNMSLRDPASLHYSAPMTLSESDAARIREILMKAITDVDAILDPSPSKKLMCLNIDWFEVR